MKIYYRQDTAPNFYFLFREHRDDDAEAPFDEPGLQHPAPTDRIIRRGGQTVGYKLGNTGDHHTYIRQNIVDWIRDHAHWQGRENDLEALKLLKEWCVWLVAIETAVIGSLAIFAKDITLWWEPGYDWGRGLAVGIVLTLGFSVFWAIHMLLALPAMSQKLSLLEPDQDIFSVHSTGLLQLQLSTYTNLVRVSSLVGFVLFVVLVAGAVIFQTMPAPHKLAVG
jgi:hypothetical protein